MDTDHFLIALVKYEEEISAKAMLAFGFNLETLRSTANEITPAQISRCDRELTITAQARAAQDGAWEEALQLKPVIVGPEHLLLAILHQQVGTASRILDASGVDRQGLRSQIFELMRAAND